MGKDKPLRKYGTVLLNYTVTVNARSKVDAISAFYDKGILVGVPQIFEMENEAGIPMRKGRIKAKGDEIKSPDELPGPLI